MQSLTFIIYIVSEKIAMLKSLPHIDNQPKQSISQVPRVVD